MNKIISKILVLSIIISLFSGVMLLVSYDVLSMKNEENQVKEKFLEDLPSQLTKPEFPEMAPYPNEEEYIDDKGEFDDKGFDKVYDAWREDLDAQREYKQQFKGDYDEFFSKTSQVILQNSEEVNVAYSPISLYLALSMLVEVTEGESRTEVLELLGQDNLEQVRSDAKSMWNMNYSADGALNCKLANSLWLNQDLKYREEPLSALTDYYYASVFQGEMGSESYNVDLHNWIDQHTGGLLEEQSGQINFDELTVLSQVSTIFYQGKWSEEFWAEDNSQGIFKGTEDDVECEFMNSSGSDDYFWADNFAAVNKLMTVGGMMWFILPDEEVEISEVLSNPQLYELTTGKEWKQSKFLIVNFSVPKFDIASDHNLKEHLQTLGVEKVFSQTDADFSPLLDWSKEDVKFPVWLSEVKQGARVAIDEEGVTAAAFTAMMYCGAAKPPDEEVDFVLDRPFIFVLTGLTNQPLFIGVVNQIER